MRFIRRLLDDERVRYLIVGGWNTIFSYGLFVVLLGLLTPVIKPLENSDVWLIALLGHNYYLVINLLGWCIAVPQSTVTMKYFAFRSEGKLLPQIGKAFMIYLPAQGLGMAILWVTVQLLHFSPQVGALITIAVTTVFSYIGHKYFTFRRPLEVGEVPPADMMSLDAPEDVPVRAEGHGA